jgi:hypothetical protein
MAERVAILGSWPDGLYPDLNVYPGMWEAWRRGSSSPWRIWAAAEPLLRSVIVRQGHVNVYVYFGHGSDITTVARMDEVSINANRVQAPGPFLGDAVPSHVWIRYRAVEALPRPIRRDDFSELPLHGTSFGTRIRPISQDGWHLMHATGLVFVEDTWGGIP